MAEIQWLTRGEGVTLPPINTVSVGKWLEEVARRHGRIVGPLTYIFTDDEGILDINRRFLQHDYYTDIITFDYSRGRMISGDMFISLDTVASNAETVSRRPQGEELHRVIVHGLLHLCGIGDKGPGEREVMETHEDEALRLYGL